MHTWKPKNVSLQCSSQYSYYCKMSVLRNMWVCYTWFTCTTTYVFPRFYTAACPSCAERKMSSESWNVWLCQGHYYQFLKKNIDLNNVTMWKQRRHCWDAKIVSVALIMRLWTNMVEFIADQSTVLQYFANCPSLAEFHRTLWKWERKFWISQNALQFVFITWLKQSLKCT